MSLRVHPKESGGNAGMADDGTEALTDILFGEAVVSLGHISPFVPGPKDSDLRELWETSLCRIRPMG